MSSWMGGATVTTWPATAPTARRAIAAAAWPGTREAAAVEEAAATAAAAVEEAAAAEAAEMAEAAEAAVAAARR